MRFVPAKVRRSSLSTGPPASEATMTSAPGMREKIVCGGEIELRQAGIEGFDNN
jgi:hypothetical protein